LAAGQQFATHFGAVLQVVNFGGSTVGTKQKARTVIDPGSSFGCV
jgi:hypothetical protein